MIKLISQFDNEKSKLSLATPTCGCCCCCCCCCIVSTIAAASISARSFGNYAEKQLPNEPEKIKAVRKFGFWQPLGLLGAILVGLILASNFLSVVRGNIGINGDTFAAGFIVFLTGLLYLAITTKYIKNKVNLPGITLRVIGFTILLAILEITGGYIGFYLLLINPLIYLGAAISVSILLVHWAFKIQYEKSTTNISQKQNINDTQENINDQLDNGDSN